MSRILGSTPSADGFGFACWSGPIHAMARPHRHAELEINHVSSGSVSVLIGGRLRKIHAGQAVAFWGAVPHQVMDADGAGEFSWVTVPFAWVLAWELPAGALRRLLRGGLWTDRSGTLIQEDDCRVWQDDLRSGLPHRRRACELEIQARLLRLAAQAPSRREAVPAGAVGPVVRMAAYIAEHFTEPLRIGDITRASGLHNSYAMTLFRKTCGMTLLEYLIQHRLFHARRLLATTRRTVLDIALASGFGSASRFHEAFQKECGCSPGQFRRTSWNAIGPAGKPPQVARS